MNETMAQMIERVIREGNAQMKNVEQISEDIAQAVTDFMQEWEDVVERNRAVGCNGPCCGGYYGDGDS